MKINDIYESTTSGSVATVAQPMTTQARNASIYGDKKGGNLLTGKKTSKKYANSLAEAAGEFKGEHVTVLYIDDKPAVKYTDITKAKKEMEILKRKLPSSKKLELKQEVREAGMPQSVLRNKQKLAKMTDAELADHLKGKSDDELKRLAWRHGYGNMSSHYVNRIKKVTESTDTTKYKVQIICDDGGETSYTVSAKTKEEALRKATKFANEDEYEDFYAKIITEPNKKPVQEGKMKELAMDMRDMDNGNFQKKYKKSKEQLKRVLGDPDKKPVQEARLEEDDLILVPGQGHRLKSGFIKHGESRLDHEVEMAKSDLFSAAKNAKQVYEMIADVSEEEGLEGWVQEKIIKANDYLNTIREYLEGKQLQEMTGGVIAGGGVGESNGVDWRTDQMKWHGGSDISWYEHQKQNPIKVKLVNPSKMGGQPKGLYTVKSFNKISPTEAEIVVSHRGQELTGKVDLDNPATHLDKNYDKKRDMEFYSGQRPITARQAFNLFQTQLHSKSSPAIAEIGEGIEDWDMRIQSLPKTSELKLKAITATSPGPTPKRYTFDTEKEAIQHFGQENWQFIKSGAPNKYGESWKVEYQKVNEANLGSDAARARWMAFLQSQPPQSQPPQSKPPQSKPEPQPHPASKKLEVYGNRHGFYIFLPNGHVLTANKLPARVQRDLGDGSYVTSSFGVQPDPDDDKEEWDKLAWNVGNAGPASEGHVYFAKIHMKPVNASNLPPEVKTQIKQFMKSAKR